MNCIDWDQFWKKKAFLSNSLRFSGTALYWFLGWNASLEIETVILIQLYSIYKVNKAATSEGYLFLFPLYLERGWLWPKTVD